MRIAVQIIVKIAAIDGSHDASVASTTPIDKMSPAGFMVSMMLCVGLVIVTILWRYRNDLHCVQINAEQIRAIEMAYTNYALIAMHLISRITFSAHHVLDNITRFGAVDNPNHRFSSVIDKLRSAVVVAAPSVKALSILAYT